VQPVAPAAPATDHPRLWIRSQDVSRLRSWATASNPLYQGGLAVLAAEAKVDMDAGHVPGDDTGGDGWEEYPNEMYAQLFAFMSLIHSDQATRVDYAQRARTLLMHVMNEAAKGAAEQPFRDPEFSTRDRSRWWGEGFALTVDWIYPSLSEADKATIRQVFLRWADENLHAEITTYNHPEPIGVVNDPILISDTVRVRWAANNYYTAHMRNIGLMAMALDPADDPNNELRDYLGNATGAWLYVVDHLLRNDGQGGLAPEGFEYSPQAMAYVAQFLLALYTAGQDDPATWGPQVMLSANPFWDDLVTAYLHSLSPATVTHDPGPGKVYQPAWYGDGQNYWAPDFIEVVGPLGLYDYAAGNTTGLEALRWVQVHLPPGGADELVERVENPDAFRDAILYFMLFDPDAAPPADPRPSRPATFYAPGLGRILARTGWGTDATWFTYSLGWLTVDHQHADGNQFEFYRRGEWLTKERTGYGMYGDHVQTSDYHNTLALENDEPSHSDPSDYRYFHWQRGSQWLYEPVADGQILAHSFGQGFVYALGDATGLYNSDYEAVNDITHASRSVVWLQPDHIVVYDRAASQTAGRFKRFWLNLPAQAVISGNRATVTAASGQQLFVTTLLPSDAVITSTLAENTEEAEEEPMKFRLRVEAPGGPQDVRFLHVLQGADSGATADSMTLVQSSSGTSFAGALVSDTAILFPVDLDAPFTGLTYTVPASTTAHLITGLTPSSSYDVVTQTAGSDVQVTINSGTTYQADSGGVLAVGTPAQEPVDAGFSGSPTSGVAPLAVDFTNESTGDYDTCAWAFGDGGTSADCNDPSHTYTTARVYTVSLAVSGSGGSDTLTRTHYITAYTPVAASFSGSPTSGVAPLAVDFGNESTGDYDTCAWAFGDGGTSADCNDPSHTYTTADVYTVSLAVSGLGGSDTLTRANLITVVTGARTSIEPEGGSLVYTDTMGNRTVIEVPADAVTETVELVYTPVETVTAPSGFAFAGHTFELDAYRDGALLSDFVFSVPVTVALHYADADVAGMDEASLILEVWNENASAWEDAACGPYDRHADENRLAVPICHLSRFALFGKERYTIYLPLVLRQHP